MAVRMEDLSAAGYRNTDATAQVLAFHVGKASP